MLLQPIEDVVDRTGIIEDRSVIPDAVAQAGLATFISGLNPLALYKMSHPEWTFPQLPGILLEKMVHEISHAKVADMLGVNHGDIFLNSTYYGEAFSQTMSAFTGISTFTDPHGFMAKVADIHYTSSIDHIAIDAAPHVLEPMIGYSLISASGLIKNRLARNIVFQSGLLFSFAPALNMISNVNYQSNDLYKVWENITQAPLSQGAFYAGVTLATYGAYCAGRKVMKRLVGH